MYILYRAVLTDHRYTVHLHLAFSAQAVFFFSRSTLILTCAFLVLFRPSFRPLSSTFFRASPLLSAYTTFSSTLRVLTNTIVTILTFRRTLLISLFSHLSSHSYKSSSFLLSIALEFLLPQSSHRTIFVIDTLKSHHLRVYQFLSTL